MGIKHMVKWYSCDDVTEDFELEHVMQKGARLLETEDHWTSNTIAFEK